MTQTMTLGNIKRKKATSIMEFFYFYPYKKNFSKGNTICQPYIREKDEVTDHKYTMEYPEWHAVITTYIEHLTEELLKGKEIVLPMGLGVIQLRKYKTKRKIDYKKWFETGTKVYYKVEGNFTVLLKWYRTYGRKGFHFKNHWMVRMPSTLGKAIHTKLTKDPDAVYNILNT